MKYPICILFAKKSVIIIIHISAMCINEKEK